MNLKKIFDIKKKIVDDTHLQQNIYKITDGVYIDDFHHEIKYLEESDNMQTNVDLSINNNPYEPITIDVTSDEGVTTQVKVYSCFRRKVLPNGNWTDANPLIYAIKGEYDWNFHSRKDRNSVNDCMEKIMKKFLQKYNYDFTIVMDSKGFVNTYMAKIFHKISPKTPIMEKLIVKRKACEVYENIYNYDCLFTRYYGNQGRDVLKKKLSELKEYCHQMEQDKKSDGYFRFHKVPDMEMRNVITNSLKVGDRNMSDYATAINNKDILLLDDSMSEGNTIRTAVLLLNKYYTPKSITVLTLFSESFEQCENIVEQNIL